MQPTLCSRCKKNVAVVYISRMENGQTVNEGLCLKCARDLGLPQVEDMMKRMGISDEELDTLNSEMLQALNGVENIEDLPAGEDPGEEDEGKTATFPFLNRLFGNAAPGGSAPEAGEPPHTEREMTPARATRSASSWRATARTSPARPGRASWTPSSAGRRRSSGWCRS